MRVRDVFTSWRRRKWSAEWVALFLVWLYYCGIKSSYIITFSLPRSGTDGKAWWECTRNNVGTHCWCEVRKEDRAPCRWAEERKSPEGWKAMPSTPFSQGFPPWPCGFPSHTAQPLSLSMASSVYFFHASSVYFLISSVIPLGVKRKNR